MDILLKSGVKPSFIRVKTLEFLLEKRTHPVVDEVYVELKKSIPTLSKTSLYNTLKLFAERGIVKIITIEGNEIRYDADIGDHGHFKCRDCGAVFDFGANLGRIDEIGLEGFRVDGRELYYYGLCAGCAERQIRSERPIWIRRD